MPSELIIRKALIDDVQHLHPLMEQLGYPQSSKELQRRLELFTSELHYGVLLAEIAGKVVGWIAWSKRLSGKSLPKVKPSPSGTKKYFNIVMRLSFLAFRMRSAALKHKNQLAFCMVGREYSL